ncbi:hypothetical protein QVD17_03747 [Tagetes erecta]|uniref:Uncharacterized protein n=1 Tax=Tagetes erecta TaxID=13708 RepID=A0AAD8LAJ4_TARER|nr:hypothetical protein QVD17_03747 [Tagetes erecta]
MKACSSILTMPNNKVESCKPRPAGYVVIAKQNFFFFFGSSPATRHNVSRTATAAALSRKETFVCFGKS